MKKQIIGIALTFFCLSRVAVANAPLLQGVIDASGEVASLPGSLIWGRTPDKDTIFPLHYHGSVRPDSVLIGRSKPNGIRFLARSSHESVPLPVNFGKKFGGFDASGNLKPGYVVQIAEYRFARDGGEPELVIAVGNDQSELIVNVLRYHAPRDAKDANLVSNWALEGTFSGVAAAILYENRIGTSYGSGNGIWEFYEYHGGKFAEVYPSGAPIAHKPSVYN